MKQYIGIKLVEAEPMGKKAFHKMQGWIVGDEEDQEGYMVKYPDDGYLGWCPKDKFEKYNFEYTGVGDAKVSKEMVDRFMGPVTVKTLDDKTTYVRAETLTGFVQHEMASCVNPEDYDKTMGAKIATERVRETLWMCLGFVDRWARYGLSK